MSTSDEQKGVYKGTKAPLQKLAQLCLKDYVEFREEFRLCDLKVSGE